MTDTVVKMRGRRRLYPSPIDQLARTKHSLPTFVHERATPMTGADVDGPLRMLVWASTGYRLDAEVPSGSPISACKPSSCRAPDVSRPDVRRCLLCGVLGLDVRNRCTLSPSNDGPQLLALHRISRCAVGNARRDRWLRGSPPVDDSGGGPGGSGTRCVVFHAGTMRSEVMDENGTRLVAIRHIAPATPSR